MKVLSMLDKVKMYKMYLCNRCSFMITDKRLTERFK